MPSAFRTVALSRKSLPIYAVEGLLLIVSFYGFRHWLNEVAAVEPDASLHFTWLVGCGLAPLLLFVAVAVRAAIGAGQMLSSAGVQFRIDQLQKRLNAQDDVFRVVNDHTPIALTIFDSNNEYWFVNAAAAQTLGHVSSNILGKKPGAVVGEELGRKIEQSLDEVRKTGKPLEVLHRDTDRLGNPRYIQTSYQRLSASGEFPGGIMARDENVTTILTEREHRETMLRQVISTLVAVVDRRDPYASGHSSRVGQLSRALAAEMCLTDREIEAAEIAGSLMNFGKVLVSRSILTKTDSLTPSELQRIRDGILTSADILSMIDFGSPVVPTLRQVLEHYDGTGEPFGLQGDAILITARIVAVANAFVAMVSPRAYRPGAEFTVAAARLAEGKGKAFDPRVIAALDSFLAKDKGKLEWLGVARQG